MRLIFFGSGEFACRTLETLAAGGFFPLLVVSQPDRPAGRGGLARATPVRSLAAGLGIPTAAPERPNAPEFAAEVAALAPDLAVVVAYGHLIRRPLLGVPRLGFMNLHASLLPAYRGAAPVPWAILGGERESGATVFQLNENFDAGAILAQESLAIAPDDTAGTYLAKLAPLGAELTLRVVGELARGGLSPREQDAARVSAAPKLKKEDGEIDWRRPCEEISRRVRAFQPWPLARTVIPTARGGMRVNVLRLSRSSLEGRGVGPGRVVAADPERGLCIMAGDVPASIEILQPEGKRPMPARDFLRGTRVTA